MEDVLDLYAEPSDAARPVVCFDALPYQLVREVRAPQPPAPSRVAREDYEYARQGTCNLFMVFQPQQGWRHVTVTARRTAHDFAQQMRTLLDEQFPNATKIRVVLDNVNTHTPAGLYQAFEAAEARRLTAKVEFHSTPKHGSWLNMGEIEWSVVARHCLDQRLPDHASVAQVVALGETRRNARRATVEWRFTVPDARTKLGHLYVAHP